MGDIVSGHWAAAQITHLVSLGVINGYPQGDGTFIFAPDRLINRAEYMKLIAASLDLPLIEGYEGSRFADWGDVEDWARPYIAALIEDGIVLGSLEGGRLFINPLSDVTREEMTVMAVRALGALPGGVGGSQDGSLDAGDIMEYIVDYEAIQDWALNEVAFAIAEGLVNLRNSSGEPLPLSRARPLQGGIFFASSSPARRDEAAVILSELLNIVNK
nr:S-layer homology domain-containing protein [Oscillospiraceae bacterium]